MNKQNDVFYLVNTWGKEIFLPDIKKVVPFNDEALEIFAINADLFDESRDIKQCIRAKMIVDVTDQVLAAKNKQEESVVGSQSNDTNTKVSDKPSIENPKNITKNEEVYIVSELDSSRALYGGDRNERINNLNSRFRDGVEKSVIIDEFESDELREKVKKQRESFIVESDSRSNPQIDPRFNLSKNNNNKSASVDFDGINIEIPAEALQKKNDYLSRQSSYTNQRNIDNNQDYWKNSSIGRERMANQQRELEIKKGSQRRPTSSPNINDVNPDINPIFSDNFENQLFAEAVDPDEVFNPLLHDVLSDDIVEEVIPEKKKTKTIKKKQADKTNQTKKKSKSKKEEEENKNKKSSSKKKDKSKKVAKKK